MPSLQCAIGIDIGGGSAKIGLVRPDGEIVDFTRIENDPAATAEDIVASYSEAVGELGARNAEYTISGVGIGYPGVIYPGGRIGGLGNVPALIDLPLADALEKATGYRTFMQNDANAAAVAEVLFGAAKDAERMLMVTAGTGIGLAFIENGKAMATSGGGLGDAGHVILHPDSGKRCRLGCLGCLEALASGDALDQVASKFACDFPNSRIAQHAAERCRTPDAFDIVRCAVAGDDSATAILACAGHWYGRAVAGWVHLFAPSAVLIGGGLSAAGNALLEPIELEARRCGLKTYMRDVSFSAASLGNDAGIVGAAAPFLSRNVFMIA